MSTFEQIGAHNVKAGRVERMTYGTKVWIANDLTFDMDFATASWNSEHSSIRFPVGGNFSAWMDTIETACEAIAKRVGYRISTMTKKVRYHDGDFVFIDTDAKTAFIGSRTDGLAKARVKMAWIWCAHKACSIKLIATCIEFKPKLAFDLEFDLSSYPLDTARET